MKLEGEAKCVTGEE
jgi:hypothetical protein